MRRHIVQAGLLVVAGLVFGGCATFELTDGSFHPKGKKLAVVAGLTNPSSLEAAAVFTDELRKVSRFEVVLQKQVAQAIPNYPQLIKGPYDSAYFEIDVNYARTDVARVKDIQKHVGTDYLYVLWAPATTANAQKSWFFTNYAVMQVIAQLFEFPGGREVGHGKYMIRINDDKKEMVRGDMQHAAKEMAEKTLMPR